MDKLFDYVCNRYGMREALGTRIVIRETEEKQSNGKVFRKYELGGFKWRTFYDFTTEAKTVAGGMRQLGLRAGDRVAIIAETRAEWIITAYACFLNNIALVTLYTNLGNSGLEHALNETEVAFVVCSMETLGKIKAVCGKCPKVENLILMSSISPCIKSSVAKRDMIADCQLNVVLYEELCAGKTHPPQTHPPLPSDCAIIMYTSGSTGNPKGVILSHRNLLASMSALINIAKFEEKDRYIGYLPLAHVLELLAEASCLLYGIKIGYSSANTLTNKSSMVKAGSKGDANMLRPTLMCSVPLILERIFKSVVDTMQRQGWAVEELFHYLVAYKMKWQDRGFDTPILNKTLFRKIRYFLGGRVRLMLSGGAPLSPDTHSLVRTCICVPLMQGYGLTETTACATVTSPHDRSTGRAGAPLMAVQIKLVNWEEGNCFISDKPHPRGEIHVGGDNVAMGYFKNPSKTMEDFYEMDGRRWFRTGDIGEFHTDGVLNIIDRKKDLVKLQHGEYVSYGKVESILKTCPIVENICLHADPAKDYLVAIVIPDKVHLEGVHHSSVDKSGIIQKMIMEYGVKNGLEKFELPLKILLITNEEWTPESGLVTAAFKIRRKQVVARYKQEIDMLYV